MRAMNKAWFRHLSCRLTSDRLGTLGLSGNRFGLIILGIQLSVVTAFMAMATLDTTLAGETGDFNSTMEEDPPNEDPPNEDPPNEDPPNEDPPEEEEDNGIGITNFSAYVDSTNLLTVYGTVVDEDLPSVFADLMFLDQQDPLSVDSNGNFSWSYQLGPGDEGMLTVRAEDNHQNQADAEDYIIPNP